MSARRLAPIFARGFAQVVLVAANTVQLAAYQRTLDWRALPGVFVVGCAINYVWWKNARSTTIDADLPGARLAYMLGAGSGTIVGAVCVAWWYR